MIKLEVLESCTLGRFAEIQSIERKSRNQEGALFVGDIIVCKEDLANYLLNEEGFENPKNRPFVKIIEVIPEIEEVVEEKIKEEKPKKTIKKKTTKKTIAKK